MATSLDAGPGLEDILSRYELKKDDFERECPQEVLVRIAVKIVDWKMTGYYFGLGEEKLAAIERDNNSEELRRVALLSTWNKKAGRSATYFKLADVLCRKGRLDLVNQLCHEYKSLVHTIRSGSLTYETEERTVHAEENLISEKDVPGKIEELEGWFNELHQRLLSELIDGDITIDKLLQALTMLPIAFRKEYESSIQQMIPTLVKQRTITELFLRLNPLFTFIDVGLLEFLVSKFCSHELKQAMKEYTVKLQLFLRETTVGEMIEYWPGDEHPQVNYSKLRAKFSDDPKTYTLERLNNFRRKFCSKIRLSQLIFILVSVESASSFYATWLIPIEIVPNLMEAIISIDKGFYEEEHIIDIVLLSSNIVLYPPTKTQSNDSTSEICPQAKVDDDQSLIFTFNLQHDKEIGLKNVQLFKDQIIGTGTFANVYKAKCDGLLCAAKVLHEFLIQPFPASPQGKYKHPMKRFQQECEIRKTMRHPNIVQFLSMYEDPDTNLPVILMELMDECLTRFLERSSQPIPYRIEVDICHDITLALSYLHSNDFTHRDLSSENVLLTSQLRAKLSGFIKTKRIDTLRRGSNLSMCPGTYVYMPPEACEDNPVYTEKLDCFSFGVIAIQILTRQFPNPEGQWIRATEQKNPEIHEIGVPEIERRHNHIHLVEQNHMILPIALDCLKNKASERPSAQQLCERMAILKEGSRYNNSVSIATEQGILSNLTSRERVVEPYLLRSGELLRQRIPMTDNVREIKIKELEKQVELSNTLVSKYRRKFGVLEYKLNWIEKKSAPREMSSVAIKGSVAYFSSNGTKVIYSYNSISDQWNELPESPTYNSVIAVLDRSVTTIGGFIELADADHNSHVQRLNSLEESHWSAEFPPLPTKRSTLNVFSNPKYLIVAGGQDDFGVIIKTVEVLNVATHQWSTTSELPTPLLHLTGTILEDKVYILGRTDRSQRPTKVAYVASLDTMTSSGSDTMSSSGLAYLRASFVRVWKKVANPTTAGAKCIAVGDRLLAISGLSADNKPTKDIYEYNFYRTWRDSWDLFTHIPFAPQSLNSCLAATIPQADSDFHNLMILGGKEVHLALAY